MAESKKWDFDAMELQWLRKSVETQRAALARARTKEMAGSEIHELRGREIQALDRLLSKVS